MLRKSDATYYLPKSFNSFRPGQVVANPNVATPSCAKPVCPTGPPQRSRTSTIRPIVTRSSRNRIVDHNLTFGRVVSGGHELMLNACHIPTTAGGWANPSPPRMRVTPTIAEMVISHRPSSTHILDRREHLGRTVQLLSSAVMQFFPILSPSSTWLPRLLQSVGISVPLFPFFEIAQHSRNQGG